MRFLIDACVPRHVGDLLRADRHDVLESVLESSSLGPDPGDREILDFAEREGGILITMDKDFGVLVYAERRRHAGLIRLPHVAPSQCAALLSQVLHLHTDALAEGAIVTVQERRIRVSRSDRDQPA